MNRSITLLCCLALLSGASLAHDAELEIPFEEFYLDNGLRVIVHEDRKAPIVAVTLRYHVGSRIENVGKTGFAHLLEHLMFDGSENYDGEYFAPFQEVGATSMNGTTNNDRTNYFQTVPTTALDLAMWMESDRMGHLLGAIDQDKLDEQRGVVQNEKRQGENQPYGRVFDYITENVFPEGHPYSWSPIGSMEDLNAASLEDVHEWFRTYYGPNNATLVLAGDVDVDTARDTVERHFGHIPPGPPVTRMSVWVPSLEQDRRLVTEDRVPQSRIYKAWPIPEWGSIDTEWLALADGVLTQGQTSRLHQRLVYEEQVATDVGGYLFTGEISGAYVVWATAQPGQDLAEVERMLDEEIELFLDRGPTRSELARVITETRAGFVRGVRRVPTKQLHTPGVEIRTRFRRPEHPLAYGYPETTSVFRQDLTLYETREADLGWVVMQWGSEPQAYHDEKSTDDGPWGVGDENASATSDQEDESASSPKSESKRDLVVSGGMKGADELEGRPAILDIPVGRGRIVAFGFDPIHRTLPRSDFRLVWNALLNWNDLPEPAANPPRIQSASTPASSGE